MFFNFQKPQVVKDQHLENYCKLRKPNFSGERKCSVILLVALLLAIQVGTKVRATSWEERTHEDLLLLRSSLDPATRLKKTLMDTESSREMKKDTHELKTKSIVSGKIEYWNGSNQTTKDEIVKLEINEELSMKVIQGLKDLRENLKQVVEEIRQQQIPGIHLNGSKVVSRKVRSSGLLGRRQQCTVSRDILSKMKDSINSALTSSHTTDLSSNFDLSNDGSEDCEALLQLIQCGVDHLNKGFHQAITNKASIKELSVLQTAFSTLSVTYQKHIDEVRRSLSQEHERKVAILATNFQTLAQNFNTVLRNSKLKTKDLCILEIWNGSISAALVYYKELANGNVGYISQTEEIVQAAYSSKKLGNVKNFVKFLTALQLYSNQQCDRGFNKLYDVMDNHGHLSSPEVLLIAEEANQNTCFSVELKNKLRENTKHIVESWGNRIRNNDFTQILEFSKKYIECSSYFLDQVVQSAYSQDSKNFDVVLSFIKEFKEFKEFEDLIHIEIAGIGLKALFEAMKGSNNLNGHHIIMIAYEVKEYQKIPHYQNIGFSYKTMYYTLEINIPWKVRLLIWNGNSCTIQNYEHDEFLYAANGDFRFDSERRKVFTWVPKGGVNSKFKWKFVTEDRGRTFAIENNKFKEYLFSSNYANVDEKRRWAFTWVPKGKVVQGNWQLNYNNDRDRFYLFNTHNREYLYADGNMQYGHGSDRRGVYTWREGKPQGVMDRESLWFVDCL